MNPAGVDRNDPDRAALERAAGGRHVLLGLGPLVLAGLFAARALSPAPDVMLLSIFGVLAVCSLGLMVGSRLGAGGVLLLSLSLFQPITAREFSFGLSSVDSVWWRFWAIASLVALGWSLVSAVVVLTGQAGGHVRSLAFVGGGLVVGVGLIPLFSAIAPQPGFGRDLDDEEIAALPVIEMLNYRYEPAVVRLGGDGIYRARVENPSSLPHNIVLDELDLEVFVPPGRWSIVEIDVAALSAAGPLELYCSIGDHYDRGMLALLEVE